MTRIPNIKFQEVRELNETTSVGEFMVNQSWPEHKAGQNKHHNHTLTNLRSIMSCNINRIRDDVFLSLTIFSIWLKYWSIRGWGKREGGGPFETWRLYSPFLYLIYWTAGFRDFRIISLNWQIGQFVTRSRGCPARQRLNWNNLGDGRTKTVIA